jgi:two-component system sensor histidine kinase HydH
MKKPRIKLPIRTLSAIAALLCWALLSALIISVVLGLRDRARLIRDNDNERIANTLFTSLRNYDDFGAAVESNAALTDRIAGIAVYGADFRPLYHWGSVPPVFDETLLGQHAGRNRFGRYTIPDPKGHSVKFILYTGAPPPPPPLPGEDRRQMTRRNRRDDAAEPEYRASPFLNALTGGRYFYIDISHPAYWRTLTLSSVLLPLAELALLVLIFYIRFLYLRNREYRERIEAQQNLVVLGTAASTLAHEIKNPLLSIRLQTGILEKTFPQRGTEEIGLINQEVDRIAALVYRVNDYLRESRGTPVPLNLYDLAEETSRRLCGKNIIRDGSIRNGLILADPDRLRSVLENIIRNALESGGPPEEIGASLSRGKTASGKEALTLQVYDRGAGIDPAGLKGGPPRIFDPFFTSKSTGTGIGLSICKRFTEAAGGTIDVENRDGGGVVVSLVFPVFIQPSPAPAGPFPGRRPAPQ